MKTENTCKKAGFIVLTVLLIFLAVSTAGCISNTTITYYVDGTQWYKTDLVSFVTGDEPKDPEKKGYVFCGWYFDKGIWNEPLTKTVDEKLYGSDRVSVYAYFVKIHDEEEPVVPPVDTPDKVEIPEVTEKPDTVEIVHYLRDYKVKPIDSEYAGAYYDESDGKIYVQYTIAEIEGAIVDEVSNTVLSQAETSVDFWYEEIKAESMSTYLENMVTSITGWSKTKTGNAGLSIKIKIKNTTEINPSVSGSITREDYGETTTVTKDSIEKYNAVQRTVGQKISTDFTILERGMWYKYVVLGDYLLNQIFVYDTNDNTVESYLELERIDSGEKKMLLVYSTQEENFETPEYSGDLLMESIDTAFLFKGTGTAENPFQVSNEADLMLMQFDKTKSYKLVESIYMRDATWFNPEKHVPSSFETEPYVIKYNNNEKYPSKIFEIKDVNDFLYMMENPAGDYILMADIDLTGAKLLTDVHFSGTLDGNNKVIIGDDSTFNVREHNAAETTDGRSITFGNGKLPNERGYGLFAKNSGEIKDLTLSNFRVLGEEACHEEPWVHVGCVAGDNSGTISNVVLKNCWVECYRTYSNVGTVAGKNTGTIKNCEVQQCYVYGNGNAGGVVGKDAGKIISCHVVGSGSEIDHNKITIYVNKRKAVESSWGGIVGHSTKDSFISDVSISDATIMSRFHDEKYFVKVNVGYIAGKKEGIIENDQVSNVNKFFREVMDLVESEFYQNQLFQTMDTEEYEEFLKEVNESCLPSVASNTYFPGSGYYGENSERGY